MRPSEWGTVESFYRRTLEALVRAGEPFLVGGGWALRTQAGVVRDSHDLDLFVRSQDLRRIAAALEDAGEHVEVVFKHWLAKIWDGHRYVDVIFNSGNAVAKVDDEWFAHAIDSSLFGIPVKLCPPEETIWSKSFVMERERCDVADVLHVLLAHADTLDWSRLLRRFGAHFRVLFAHLVLFGYVYPSEARRVPRWVMDELAGRLRDEGEQPIERVCCGTLLSREQYLVDVEEWGFRDGRLPPHGRMRPSEIEAWTAAITEK